MGLGILLLPHTLLLDLLLEFLLLFFQDCWMAISALRTSSSLYFALGWAFGSRESLAGRFIRSASSSNLWKRSMNSTYHSSWCLSMQQEASIVWSSISKVSVLAGVCTIKALSSTWERTFQNVCLANLTFVKCSQAFMARNGILSWVLSQGHHSNHDNSPMLR
jgi:hypothetical protein